MADVKIIDIDNIQWNIKDQVARDKIIALETKTTVKVINKVSKIDFIMNLIEINDEKFLQLHFSGLYWSGEIGETVATFNNDFGLVDIVRCMIGMDFIDGSGRDTLGFDIEHTGNIKAYPQTVNQLVGMYRAGRIYGDAFIRVKH